MNGKKCKRTRKLDRSLVCIAFRFGKDGESWEGGFNAKYQRRTKSIFFKKNFAFTRLKERVSLLCCERLTRLYFFFICDFAAMGVDVLDTSVAVFGVFKRY